MTVLNWVLSADHSPRFATLALPMDTVRARSVLRAQALPASLAATVSERGSFPDVLSAGFSFLLAVSPSAIARLTRRSGAVFVPVSIMEGPSGYGVLAVEGRCGNVDYARSSVESERAGFLRLRGLVVDNASPDIDFAVPANRDSILISDEVAAELQAIRVDGIRLRRMEEITFDIPRELRS